MTIGLSFLLGLLASSVSYFMLGLWWPVAVVVGLFVAGTSFSAWSRRHANPAAALAGGLLLAVYGLQVLLGAVTAWGDFPAGSRALHPSFATLVWVITVVFATMAYLALIPI